MRMRKHVLDKRQIVPEQASAAILIIQIPRGPLTTCHHLPAMFNTRIKFN